MCAQPEKTPLQSRPAQESIFYSYLQLTRLHLFPLGSILFFWPCAFGIMMAATGQASTPRYFEDIAELLGSFTVGATLVHSAACVLSDICDRDFDAQVERTKTRPLVTGKVSIVGAWAVIVVLMAPVFAALSLANARTVGAVLFGVVPLNIIYPLTKRWTWWPQFWLGLAINCGIFAAWYTVVELPMKIMSPPPLMFAGLVCWTIVYDTIYACQDRADDIKAGVKSTALLFGRHVRLILFIFSFAFVSLMILAGAQNGNGIWYFVVSCGGAALHLVWQLSTWDETDNTDSAAKFQANGNMGYIVFSGLVMDYIAKIITL